MRRGSKRTIEDANLARQDADRSDDMPCTKKKKFLKECLEEALHHPWLPAQEYEIPGPGNSSRGCPSRIHVHACALAHRAANINRMSFLSQMLVLQVGGQPGSQAPGGYVTRGEAKFGDFALVSRRGPSLLMPTEIGFRILLSLLSPSCLKGVLASCTQHL